MGDLMQPSSPKDDEMAREYNRIITMVEKKLYGMGNEELKFANLSDAISVFIASSSKKERELKLQLEKVEFEMGEVKRRREEAEHREMSHQNTISKLTKDNQLVKTNLR